MAGGDFSVEGKIVIAAVTQGMEQAVATIKGIEAAAEKSAKSIKTMGERMAAVGKKMGDIGRTMSLAVSAPLIGLGALAVKSASDLTESMDAVKQTFGASSDEIVTFSKNSATALGISQQATLAATATFGALLTGVGLATDASAKFSEQLVTNATDIASRFTVAGGAVQVSEQLRAALVGETDGLRAYGIVLTEATVQAELHRLGQDKLTGSQLEAAKVSARYALIQEKGTKIWGDFGETSGSVAGQWKIAQALFANAGVQLGTVLLPSVLKMTKVLIRMIEAFSRLPPGVKTAILAIAGIAIVVGPALTALSALIAIAPLVRAAFFKMLGPVGLLITALTLLGVAYATNFLHFADAVNAVAGAIMTGLRPVIAVFSFLGSLLVRGLGAGLSVVGSLISTVFDAAAKRVVSALQPVISFISILVSTFKTLRTQGFDPVSAAIAAFSRALLSIGGDHTPTWIVTLAEKLRSVARAVRLFLEGFRKLGGADAERVHKILNQLPAPLAKLLILFGRIKAAVTVFTRAWNEAGALAAFRTIPRSLELIGRTFGNLMASIGFGRFGAVMKTVFADVGRVIDSFVSLIDALVHGRWSAAWTAFKDLATNAVDLFREVIRAHLAIGDDLVALFTAIPWTRIGAALLAGFLAAVAYLRETGIPRVREEGGALIEAVWTGMLTFWDETVQPWLAERLPAIADAFTGAASWLITAGVDLITGLIDGVSVRWTQFTHYLGDLAGSIPAYLGNAGTLLYNAGYDLVSGFIQGVAARWNDLVHYIQGLVDKLPHWVRVQLDAESPSKVFMEIGKDTVDGFAVGFGESWRDLERLARLKTSSFATVATPRVRPVSAFAPSPIARTINATITIPVSGAGDPDAVAARVYQQLDGAFRRLEMEARR